MDRFWAKVNKTPGLGPSGECWEWLGSRTKDGYGRFFVTRTNPVLAHRYSFTEAFGLGLGTEQKCCHKCDNPSCVRPSHLFSGTQQINVQDMIKKGRRTNGSIKLRKIWPAGFSRCYKCTQILPVGRFGPKGTTWNGISKICRECANMMARKRRLAKVGTGVK